MRSAGHKKERMRRASKREHGGAVTTIEWWCERADGGANWRDGETTEESGEAVLILPQRGALLTISGPWWEDILYSGGSRRYL